MNVKKLPNYCKDYVYFTLESCHINYVNRIIEGYEYLGVMTTLQKDMSGKNIMLIRTTKYTKNLTIEVLKSLDVEIDLLDM